jgi:4-hydroxy-2-oxoheptanedioate aldolase
MSGKIKHFIAGLVAAIVGAAVSAAAQAAPVNKTIDPSTWVYGPLYPASSLPVSASAATWGPGKLAFANHISWAWGTQSEYGLASYCATALKVSKAGAAPATPVAYPDPSTWTEMQHSANDLEEDWAMWSQPCAYAPAGTSFAAQTGTIASTYGYAPGTRMSTLLRRDIEKALDGGVINLNVPTVDSVEEAEDIINTELYPPLGHRQYRPGTQAEVMYANVPGGYRATFNENLFTMNMIETILGSQAASDIGALQATIGHPDALFGATSDLGNFSGFVSQTPTLVDYELLIRNAYTAAHTHYDYACSAFGFDGRTETFSNPETGPVYNGGAPFVYSFDCYQN